MSARRPFLIESLLAGAVAPATAVDGEQLMERMARDREIAFGSATHERARGYYRANMAEVIDLAQKRGVDNLLSTLASNLRDQPPFVSLHGEGVSESAGAQWARLFDRGGQAANSGGHSEATGPRLRANEAAGCRSDPSAADRARRGHARTTRRTSGGGRLAV